MADEPKPEIDMKEEERKTKEIVENKEEKPVETPKQEEKVEDDARKVSTETPKPKEEDEEKPETKKPIQTKPKIKKTEAVVNSKNLQISTKYSSAICRFIKNKKIEEAVADLEKVLVNKKAVPMKGEIPHRKGKGIMSGRYPKKASEYFIKLLKSLQANANTNELDNPIIVEAVANIGSRPYGRFGRIRRKRTHVKIKAKEKKLIKGDKKK
jgi:large subunit ribosomal protein L22